MTEKEYNHFHNISYLLKPFSLILNFFSIKIKMNFFKLALIISIFKCRNLLALEQNDGLEHKLTFGKSLRKSKRRNNETRDF